MAFVGSNVRYVKSVDPSTIDACLCFSRAVVCMGVNHSRHVLLARIQAGSKMNVPNKKVAGSSSEIYPEILYTCYIICAPVNPIPNGVFSSFFSPDIWSFLFWGGI